jgi:uncharacterized protein
MALFALAMGAIALRRTSTPEGRAPSAGSPPVEPTPRPRSGPGTGASRTKEGRTSGWPYVYRVIDSSAFIDEYNRVRLQEYLWNLYLESGADVRFEFLREVSGDPASYARNRMRTLGIGRATDGRAMLVVYDIAQQQLRIEVGPGLEAVFPDGFVGYLAREEMARFFASGDRVLGIKAMIFIIADRLRHATLGEEFSPRTLAAVRDSTRLSAGAGATVTAPISETRELRRLPPASPSLRARYAPQPTVAAVHALYLERLRDGDFEPDLPIFTPNSEGALRAFPLTRPYADFILFSEYGQKYRIVERGDLAILYFTTTPFVSSHLFRRSPLGWQLDIGAEVHDTRERIGWAYTWEMMRTGDDYLRTFGDLFAEIGGVLRPMDGDNRPLPVRKHP